MNRYLTQLRSALLLGVFSVAMFSGSTVLAQTAPALGQAGSFAVLGGSAISNTGGTVITGDLGIWPNSASSITGFPPGVIIGTTHAGDAVAQQAQADLTTAYNDLAGRACNTVLTGTDLGGLTLTPGVYCFATAAQLTGTLTLDAQGSANAVFIFQVGSTLTTASNASVLMINGGSDCGVFWQIGSSATIGTGTQFAGNILALSSITATTGSSVSGRVLARNGAVTLDTNSVTVCAALCPPITLTPTTLPNGILGSAYSQIISASGGASPYVFSVLAGSLPPGLSLDPNSGVLSGAPTLAGSFTFTVQAADAMGCFGSRVYTIVINGPLCPVISLSPATLPNFVRGSPYSQSIVASGGMAPYVYTVSAGSLPAGIVLNAVSGQLSGTPTALGNVGFTITATDANGCLGALTYNSQVVTPMCPLIALAPQVLPVMVRGQPYSQPITASGGTAPYVYSVSGGALPPGLSLGATSGLLSGVPTTVGNSSFQVTATDAAGCRGIRSYAASIVLLVPPQFIPGPSASVLLLLAGLLSVMSALALRRA